MKITQKLLVAILVMFLTIFIPSRLVALTVSNTGVSNTGVSNLKVSTGYNHARYAPNADIERKFAAFTVSFDSKDDDDGDDIPDLRRVPEWVAQHIKRVSVECLDTGNRPTKWFTDNDLFRSGVAPNDDSYRNSGYDRGHMAAKLLAARVSKKAEWNTHTVLNAVPQHPRFNQQIWRNLEELTGAWAQVYGEIWVIQGPVFDRKKKPFTIGDATERKVVVPDALYKIVIREKTDKERKESTDLDKDIPEVLVFLYPQLGPRYYGSKNDFQHERFLTTLSEIEKLTGLVFFAKQDELNLNSKKLKLIREQRAEKLWSIEIPSNESHLKLFVTGCSD